MSAKKTTKTKAAKETKARNTRKTKTVDARESAPAENITTTTGECPRGGDHEWVDSDDGRHCSKCLEPAGAPTKAKRGRGKAKATTDDTAAPKTRGRKAKGGEDPEDANLSAIDAAAKVLAEFRLPMNCKQLIEAMATKGYWTSPGGKTPHATLYSAILREIAAKGDDARFRKTERGHFTVNG